MQKNLSISFLGFYLYTDFLFFVALFRIFEMQKDDKIIIVSRRLEHGDVLICMFPKDFVRRVTILT